MFRSALVDDRCSAANENVYLFERDGEKNLQSKMFNFFFFFNNPTKMNTVTYGPNGQNTNRFVKIVEKCLTFGRNVFLHGKNISICSNQSHILSRFLLWWPTEGPCTECL